MKRSSSRTVHDLVQLGLSAAERYRVLLLTVTVQQVLVQNTGPPPADLRGRWHCAQSLSSST